MKICNVYILILCTFLSHAYGQSSEESCDFNIFFPSMEFINSFYDNGCKLTEGSEDKYCACLKNSNNSLIQSLNEKEKSKIDDYKNAVQKDYKSRLLNLYSQMNFEAGIEERKYGIVTNKDGESGCTPSLLAKKFQAAIFDEHGVKEQKIDSVDLSKCSEASCVEKKYKEINSSFDKNKKSNDYKKMQEAFNEVSKAAEECGSVNPCLTTNESLHSKDNAVKLVSVPVNAWDIPNNNSGLSVQSLNFTVTNLQVKKTEFSDEQKNNLKGILAFYSKHPALVSDPSQISSIQSMVGVASSPEEYGQLYDLIVYEYKFKASSLGESNDKEIPLKAVSDLEKDFLAQDKLILEKISESMNESKLPNSCVDYETFKTIKSVPSESLINSWANLDERSIAKSLDPANIVSGGQSETLDFLKHNPLLSKLISSPKNNRDALAASLKSMAIASKGKSRALQSEAFINLMKNDIPKLTEGIQLSDLYQCERLAQSFAAVFTSPSLPPPPMSSEVGTMDGLANNLLSCEVASRNKSTDHNLTDVLASNELFRILNTSKSPKIGAEFDIEYKDFLDKNCQSYDKFATDYIAKKCNGEPSCINELGKLGSLKNTDLRNNYLKEKPELAQLYNTVNKNINKVDPENLKDITNESKQSVAARDYYEKNVRHKVRRSLYSTSSTTSSSRLSKFMEKAEKDLASQENTSAPLGPSSENVTYDAPVKQAIPSLANETLKKPGQFTPEYFNNAAVSKDPTKPKSVSDITEGLKNLEDLPAEEQASFIDHSKEFLKSQDQAEKQIAEINKKIAAFDQQIKKPSTKTSKNSFSNSTNFVNSNSTPSTGQSTTFHSTTSQTSSGSPARITAGTTDRAAASYKQALNQIHEKSNPASPDISALTVEGSAIILNGNPIGRNELEGQIFLITDLTPSIEDFQKIAINGETLKAYLLKNLEKTSESQFVTIKCTDSFCDSNKNEILLYVSRDVNNQLQVRPVERVFKIEDLNSDLLHETKIK